MNSWGERGLLLQFLQNENSADDKSFEIFPLWNGTGTLETTKRMEDVKPQTSAGVRGDPAPLAEELTQV